MLQDSAIYNLDRKGTAYEQKQQNKTKGIKKNFKTKIKHRRLISLQLNKKIIPTVYEHLTHVMNFSDFIGRDALILAAIM